MDDEISELQRDDITFDTEETDDISQISAPDVVVQAQEEGAIIVKNNNNNNDKEVAVAKNQHKHVSQKKQHKKSNVVNENENSTNNVVSQKKLLWGVIVLLAIVVGILAGMLVTNKEDEDDMTAMTTSDDAQAIPMTQPTPAPSNWAPTTLRGRVEYILADYVPLDEPTMTWLLETSTWTPPLAKNGYPDDVIENYEWLERYAMGLLYSSTNGPNWARNDNWMSNEPTCRWFSLEPNACPGPVTNLVLCK